MNEFSLDLLKIGYFIQYRKTPRGGFFGNQIERQQLKAGFPPEDAKFIHVEVSWGGLQAVSVSPPRTKIIDITKKHRGRYIRIIRYKKYKGPRERYRVALWSTSLNNLKYDWLGCLRFRIKWIFHRIGKFFCSENAAWALQKEYPEAGGGRPPDKWMPAHFSTPDEFEVDWEGCIC